MDSGAEPIRVLHVDDDADFLAVAARFLERADDAITVETVTGVADGLDRLAGGDVDCVVSDYEMPGPDGIAFLETVRERWGELPFILFTGKGSEEVAGEAIRTGVTDYLQKGHGTEQYRVLANRIRNAVEGHRAQQLVERAYRAMDRSREGMALLDEDGAFIYVNEAYCEVVGYEPDELVGSSWERVYPEELVAWVYEALLPAVPEEGFWSGETVYERRDGTHVNVDHAVTYADEGTMVCLIRERSDDHPAGSTVPADEGLDRTGARLEALFEQSPDMINVHDAAGNILDPNRRLREMTGFDEETLIDMKVWELDETLDPEAATDAWDAMAVGDRLRVEGAYRRGDGTSFPVEVHVRRLDLEDEDRFIAISRDISDRTERERELEAARRRFDAVFNNPLAFMALLEPDGTVVEVNETALTFAERAAETIVGRPFWETPWWTHSSALQADLRSWIERAAAGELVRFEAEHFAPDGASVTVDGILHPIRDEAGEVVGLLAAGRDISARKERESRMEGLHGATRELIQASTADTIADILAATAADLLQLPHTGVHLYDDDAEALVPVSWTAGIDETIGEPPALGPESLAWAVFEAGETRVFDDLEEHNGLYNERTPLRSELIVPLGAHGVIIVGATDPRAFDEWDRRSVELLSGNAAAALDRVSREAELRQRERELERSNERLEEFAEVVSHDLRNPLHLAEGRLELARETCDSEHLDSIEGALDRMGAIIEGVLWLAREGRDIGGTEPVALREAVTAAWAIVATDRDGASLRLPADAEHALPTIEADDDRLRQLLENLFRNAIEHAGPGVTVRVGPLPEGFYVEDDGPGIPVDERSRVFEAGYSTSRSGTGFGLRIVEQVAEAHGWSIDVTDGHDGGARFEVTGVSTAAKATES